jgi:hypothetical protein
MTRVTKVVEFDFGKLQTSGKKHVSISSLVSPSAPINVDEAIFMSASQSLISAKDHRQTGLASVAVTQLSATNHSTSYLSCNPYDGRRTIDSDE